MIQVPYSNADRRFGAEIKPNEMVATVEVCSLRTAARADGQYISYPFNNREYDMAGNIWRNRPSVSRFEVGRFAQAYIFGKNRWKVLTPDGLYIENIGYVETESLTRIEKWPTCGGSFNIRDKSPTQDYRGVGSEVLLFGGDNAFFHWIMNWLPRLMLLDFMPELTRNQNLKVLVSKSLPKVFLQSLVCAGVSSNQILELDYNYNYVFSNVIVPRFFDNLSTSTAAVEWLQRIFLATYVSPHSTPQSLLYISRADAPYETPRRRVVNETDVINRLAKLGFQSCQMSNMEITQQAEIFANARMIVSPHGAALANVSFCKPGTRVLVLENSANMPYFKSAFRCLEHNVQTIQCEDIIDTYFEEKHPTFERRNRDMVVDLAVLETTVEEMLKS